MPNYIPKLQISEGKTENSEFWSIFLDNKTEDKESTNNEDYLFCINNLHREEFVKNVKEMFSISQRMDYRPKKKLFLEWQWC